MRSFGEVWDEIREDPVKLKRVFTVIWVSAYSMLMIGSFIIIWFLSKVYLF
ncbi:MAG: hypothetical protein VB016_06715 [Methanomassiliicoccaceae archaeon]|nr:hypothetical protein [Methanomassiliicoccaceae archaeon]